MDGLIWIIVGMIGSLLLFLSLNETDYGLYVLFVGSIIFGFCYSIVAGITNQKQKN